MVFFQFECCGVNNYEDFNVSTGWDKTLGSKLTGALVLLTPIACCKTLPTTPTAFTCAQAPFDETANNGKIVRYMYNCHQSLYNRTTVPVRSVN